MRAPIIDHPTTTYEPVTMAEAFNCPELEGWTVGTSNPVRGRELWPCWYATEEEARAAILIQLDTDEEIAAEEAEAGRAGWADHEDEEPSRCATPGEALAEFARNAGADRPDKAWLLSDYDTWHANPSYRGPPVRHPEDDHFDPEEEAEVLAQVAAEFAANVEIELAEMAEDEPAEARPAAANDDDDFPF